MSDQRKPYYLVQTAERALTVLNAFLEEKRPLPISELTSKLGIHKSIVHRLVATLAHYNYLEKVSSTENYRIGVKSFEIGISYNKWIALIEESAPYLKEIAYQTGNVAHLAVLHEDIVLYLVNLDPASPSKMYPYFSWRAMVHFTALGKALLAWKEEDHALDILQRVGMPARTPKTITSPIEYLKELHQVKQLGYALDDEEGDLGYRCLSVPVRNQAGEVIAAISMTGTVSSIQDSKLEQWSQYLMKCAERIFVQLGQRNSFGEGSEINEETEKKEELKPGMQEKPYYLMQTVERMLFVLEQFAKTEKPMGVTELARKLQLHKSIVHRLTATLSHYHYLEKEPASDRYRIGPKAFQLSAAYMSTQNMEEICKPWLDDLAKQSNYTVNLSVREQDSIVDLLRIESRHAPGMYSPLGSQKRFHTSSIGKCLLAWSSENNITTLLQRIGMPPRTSNTITKIEDYTKELESVRQLGYALDDEESKPGFCCLGMPIYDYTGDVVAALSLSDIPASAMSSKKEELIHLLRSYAGNISKELGRRYTPLT